MLRPLWSFIYVGITDTPSHFLRKVKVEIRKVETLFSDKFRNEQKIAKQFIHSPFYPGTNSLTTFNPFRNPHRTKNVSTFLIFIVQLKFLSIILSLCCLSSKQNYNLVNSSKISNKFHLQNAIKEQLIY